MKTFQQPNDRALILMSAGNLGITQAAVNLLEMPEEVRGLLPQFETAVCAAISKKLEATGPDDILVLQGCGALFGLAKLAPILDRVSDAIPGRLLVLFPGRHASGIYRLLDARDAERPYRIAD